LERIEKIGAFYIGREYDPDENQVTPQEIIYDARDLTTHAVCVGMTGSGKTGLCIGILEEAALDGVPAVIIDPKGDITNLLLTFPDLLPEDFKPWVNIDDASRKGMTVDDYAVSVAETWRRGLDEWGQSPDRIRALKNSADFQIYTPGSDAGTGISILSALVPPALDWETDAELIREQIEGVVSALLGLMGIEADPLQSREYILLSNIVEHYWKNGEAIDLPMLITSVQTPPVKKMGVFDTDTFFPQKDRFKFALSLNSIVASPGFQSWLSGEPLDVGSLLFSPSGRPKHSIVYLAHLPESQRMFFITLLLERTITWMRAQSGTTSLRALLYFDEVFGYLPPVSEPPSKRPLLTLLKQARAFGLGLVLTTQNPVDLDYKGLSNAGTWFVGRLQTERDKSRLLDGLESVSTESGAGFNRSSMNDMISSLGSRVFILHNVHEPSPVVFQTRWAMSYLRGPMTRDQIRALRKEQKPAVKAESPKEREPFAETAGLSSDPPVIAPGVQQSFLPPAMSTVQAIEKAGTGAGSTGTLVYRPALLADATVSFVSARQNVSKTEDRGYLLFPENIGIAIDWTRAEAVGISLNDLSGQAEPGSAFEGAFPVEWTSSSELKSITREYSDHLYFNSSVKLPFNTLLKLNGTPDESVEDFGIRCREKAREFRDSEVDKLRETTRIKLDRLQTKLEKEERELEEDRDNYRGRKNEEMLSAGETIAGVLGIFGRRRTSGLSSAARRRRMTQTAKSRIGESEDEIKRLEEDIRDLETSVKEQAEDIVAKWEEAREKVEILEIKPRRTDVRIRTVTPVWLPVYFITPADGGAPVRIPAWKNADQVTAGG